MRKRECKERNGDLGKRPEEEEEEETVLGDEGKGWHVRVFGGGLMLHQRQVARLTSSVCENCHRLVKLQVVRVVSQIKSTGSEEGPRQRRRFTAHRVHSPSHSQGIKEN